ncbi:hypothetical protein D3C87_1737090 [compost metagenome]
MRELLAFDLLFEHVEQMHRVGRHFSVIEVEHAGEDFKCEPRGQSVHPFVDTGVVAILLIGLRFRIGVFQAFTVIDAHF